jgi:hypothetical protein
MTYDKPSTTRYFWGQTAAIQKGPDVTRCDRPYFCELPFRDELVPIGSTPGFYGAVFQVNILRGWGYVSTPVLVLVGMEAEKVPKNCGMGFFSLELLMIIGYSERASKAESCRRVIGFAVSSPFLIL